MMDCKRWLGGVGVSLIAILGLGMLVAPSAQAAVDQADKTAFTFTGPWEGDAGSSWSTGPGATAVATVRCDAPSCQVTLLGDRGVFMGRAQVTVDSSSSVLRSLYSQDTTHGVRDWMTTPSLAPGEHTIRVVSTDEKDPQATGVGTSIAGISVSNGAITSKPAPPPPPVGTYTATGAAVDADSARLSWTASGTIPGLTGWFVQRDNTDRSGTGVWSTTIAESARTFQFDYLVNDGRTYNLTVDAIVNGVRSNKSQTVAVKMGTATTPPTTPPTNPPPGGTWLSGSTKAETGTFRGDPIDSISTWHDTTAACENQWTLNGMFAGWNGPMVTIIGAFNDESGITWQSASTGAADAHWRKCLVSIRDAWVGRGKPVSNLYISFAHEANGTWYDWSVTNAQRPAFKAAFARFDALQNEIIPGAKIVFAANADQVQSGYDVDGMLPAADDYDVLGVDIYSMHNLSEFDRFPGYARAAGKPLMIQEWGIKRDEGGGANWVQGMRDRIVANAGTGPGQVFMENYFDIGEYAITGNTSSPQGAQRYRDLW